MISVSYAHAEQVSPPAVYGPAPSSAQLAWQHLEFIAFVHFNINTFTGSEWGSGKEDPKLFNPTHLDCGQWVRVLKAAGVRQIILTAKHHDGFCLWPSKYTEHSVKNSPWKDGRGDVLQEFSSACKKAGMKLGIYVSPWDRNSPYYGDSDRYNAYFKDQLTEVLTHYGEVSEVWFDGANGEGPNGKRQVYDWKGYCDLVHKLAPHAVIFGGGPEIGGNVRWVGNEDGFAPETNWCRDGDRNGKFWNPAECDVSIRPGWFYHADQDGSVKSVSDLLNVYYGSVGRGAVLLLNVPPDARGLIADADIQRLTEFRQAINQTFAHDLAAGQPVTASNVRGGSKIFSPTNLVGSKTDAYWATDDDVRQASVVIDLQQPKTFNNIVLQEYIPLGQRIAAFTVDGFVNGGWHEIASGTTIGCKRILWIPKVTASKVRITITEADACPTLSKVGLYLGPFDAPVKPAAH